MKSVSSVELMRPPMTTAASGFWISLPGPVAKSIGTKTESGDARGDEHRSKSQDRALEDCEVDGHAFSSQFIEVTDHDHAIEHGDAEEGDEADARADAQIKVSDDERENASDHRERDIQDDQHGLLHRVEGAKEHQKNRRDGDGHDDREALHGALLIFELPAPRHDIARRQLHRGIDLPLCLLNKPADVTVRSRCTGSRCDVGRSRD